MNCRLIGLFFAVVAAFALPAVAADQPKTPEPAFGDSVQLAPFVVNGKKLSIAVHARTKSDRHYGEKFAEEVVSIAYETMGTSTGNGLVIVGREGEPHPVIVLQKFQALAASGALDPAVAQKVGELAAQIAAWKSMLHLDQEIQADPDGKAVQLTFELIMPALPLPLEGLVSKLYQLSWDEGFDDARIEQRLKALTPADLEKDTLSKYDWVFYLPPRDAYIGVQKELMKEVMEKQKMGLLKRAAVRSALFAFKPAIKKAVEGMRQGMLFLTILRTQSDYSKDDTLQLTQAYVRVLMPDFKFNGGTEHKRALEAIEAQKIKNAEYAKDPFITPARLATFDAAAYAMFEGNYGAMEKSKGSKMAKPSRIFSKQGDVWYWQYAKGKPVVLYPAAGDRLFVSADGKLTVQFLVNAEGVLTGAEERRERYRRTVPRLVEAVPGG